MIHLRIDDFCHVGPVLGPKSRQLGRRWRHLGPQEPPTWPPRGLQELGFFFFEDVRHFFENGPQDGPRPILDPIFMKFGSIFDETWIKF